MNLEDVVLRGEYSMRSGFAALTSGEVYDNVSAMVDTYEQEGFKRVGIIRLERFSAVSVESAVSGHDEPSSVVLSHCADTSNMKVLDAAGQVAEGFDRSDETYLELEFVPADGTYIANVIVANDYTC